MKARARIVATSLALAAAIRGGDARADDAAETQLVKRALVDVDAAASAVAARGDDGAALSMERATALVERYVDVAGFEARVLFDVRASLTPAQQKALSDELRPLLVRRVALRLRGLSATKPTLEAPREENGEVHLRLRYKDAEGDLDADFVFAKRAAGAPPRIVDAIVLGSGLTKNMRASVNRVLRRDGFDGLMARLKRLREAKTPGPHKTSDTTL